MSKSQIDAYFTPFRVRRERKRLTHVIPVRKIESQAFWGLLSGFAIKLVNLEARLTVAARTVATDSQTSAAAHCVARTLNESKN